MRTNYPTDDHFENPFFIGTVEDNNDPTNNYRVKVRIPKLHNDLMTTEQLPWAARVDTAFMGMSEDGDLNHAVPEVGSQLLLLAVSNDPNSLLYMGCLYKKTMQTPIDRTYADTYGIYRKDGQFIGIDKVLKYFQVLFDGTINIDKVLDAIINVQNTIDTKCTTNNLTNTNTNIKTSQTIKTEANDISTLVHNNASMTAGNIQVKANQVKVSCGSMNVTTLAVDTAATGAFVTVGGIKVVVKNGIVISIS